MTANLGGTVVVWRYYLNVASNPTTNCAVGITVADLNENGAGGLGYKTSDGKYYACGDDYGSVVFGSTGVTLSAGQHCVDCRLNVAANPWVVDVEVDGVSLGQLSSWVHSETTIGNVSVGNEANAAVTCDYYVDDVVVSLTSADYPIGAGEVKAFVPNADGTHTFTGTNGVRGTTAAPTGGGNIAGSSDSYLRLNARPMPGGGTDSTFLWNQQTNASGEYGEVQFEEWAGAAGPRGVEVLVALRDASTAVGDRTAKISDNGTENTVYASGAVAGIASDYYARKHYATAPSTGIAWTKDLFNDVRFRYGYSADADPDHFCRGVMLEAEFAETPVNELKVSIQEPVIGSSFF